MHKATSMIPTVLSRIPGAPFIAVIMALFMYLGFELGTTDSLTIQDFLTV